MRLRDVILSDHPSFYWPLDDSPASTAARDLSGNARPGVLNGTLAQGTPLFPGMGSSLVFNGTNAFVSRAHDAIFDIGAGDFTITAWADVSGSPQGLHMLFDRDAAINGTGITLCVQQATNTMFSRAGSGGVAAATRASGAKETIGFPHSFATSRVAGVLYLYLDGELVATDATAANSVQTNSGIRCGTDFAGDWARGRIQHLAFWHTRALPPRRLLAQYLAGRYGARSGRT